MLWLIYILSAALMAGIADIFIKKITASRCETYDLVLFTFVISGFLSIPLLYFRFKNKKFNLKYISKNDYFNLVTYSVLYLILTVLYFEASKIINNPDIYVFFIILMLLLHLFWQVLL